MQEQCHCGVSGLKKCLHWVVFTMLNYATLKCNVTLSSEPNTIHCIKNLKNAKKWVKGLKGQRK